jgi:membrane-associated phospholipid phosphatase
MTAGLTPSPPAAPARAHRRLPTRPVAARILAALVALLLLVPHSSVLEHRAVVAVFLLALLTGRGRLFVRDWLPLVGVAALFVVLRQLAAASPFPHQGASVAALETRLFGGVSPPTWLQERFYQPGSPGPLEYLATAVHASYFFGFVAVGLGIWLVRREWFDHYRLVLALTFAFGLLGYVLLPTEPPWLGAREGFAPPAARVIAETAQGTQLSAGIVAAGRSWQQDPDALGDPNPAAAMPSVHTAVTASLALVLARIHPVAGALGALYLLAMGASLVYLGEHYVLDVLAGILCSLAAAWLAGRVKPSWTPPSSEP